MKFSEIIYLVYFEFGVGGGRGEGRSEKDLEGVF